jgi:hypothetical protein
MLVLYFHLDFLEVDLLAEYFQLLHNKELDHHLHHPILQILQHKEIRLLHLVLQNHLLLM